MMRTGQAPIVDRIPATYPADRLTSGIASFDVFDTTLTRLIGSPRQVFTETGRRLRAAGVVDLESASYAAVRERVLAEFSTDVARHPTLATVTAEVASRLDLPSAAAAMLAETELAVEADVLRAVPGMVERVAAERTRTGRGVLFVSDTPLPADFLRDVLRREGLFEPDDRLYTSSASGASKQHGGLFDVVRADLGVDARDLGHLGDDDEADVINARLHGWRAELTTAARLTKAELRSDAAADATDGLGARLAGSGRMGRLGAVAAGADPAISAIAGGTALPLLIGYGLWLLGRARVLGLDRLHFVARDGEILMQVTQALAAARGQPIECRYLYGSRRVWQLAARGTAAHADEELWLPDAVAGIERTPGEILGLVGLTVAEAYEATCEPMFASGPPARLGVAGFTALQKSLGCEPLRSLAQKRARERRDVLLRYLDAEQVTAPGQAGIVDVGWTGRASKALENVLTDGGRPLPAAHLFVGLLADAPAVMGADLHARSHGWLVDEPAGRHLELAADEDLVMLIETFTMGSEGSTDGYADRDGVVRPVLAAGVNPAIGAWRFDDYRLALGRALDAFVDGFAPGDGVDLRALVADQLVELWRRPNAAQAAAWGAQPYGEDFANTRSHPLATPLTTRRLLTRVGLGRAEWREPTYWTAGSIAVSAEPWRTLLGSVHRRRGVPQRLRRLPRRLRAELARRGTAS